MSQQYETQYANCKTCARQKHCFVKEFKVLCCEGYKPAGEMREFKDVQSTK